MSLGWYYNTVVVELQEHEKDLRCHTRRPYRDVVRSSDRFCNLALTYSRPVYECRLP
jgi:hypothetical protein